MKITRDKLFYCLRPMSHDAMVPRAVEQFRAKPSLDDTTVRDLLAKHMTGRIDQVVEGLRFIVENTRYPDPETAIHDSFGFNMSQRKREGLALRNLAQAEQRHTTAFLDDAREQVGGILAAESRLEAFQRFSQIEVDFEPVEDSVQGLVGEVDEMIQLQIDIARGK